MRNLSVGIFLFIGCFLNSFRSMAQVGANADIDVLAYEFNLDLNDANDRIEGLTRIQLKAENSVTSLQFDLASLRPDGKGMQVRSVLLAGDPIAFTHASDKLRLNLPLTLKKGDSASFEIRYAGIPADGLIISKNKYQHRTFFADNWPNRAHQWLPCKDEPSDKARVTFSVTVPEHYQVISNGIKVEETGLANNSKRIRYSETVPLPTKVMVLGVADFSEQMITELDCIPVTAWVYREEAANAIVSFGSAPDGLQFLIDRVGPYPYRKLANVQSKTMFGGLENASAIFYFEDAVHANAHNESLVMHEVSHQWFGNSATETSFAHLWLSEGFATYMTHLYIGNKYGDDSLRKEMIKDRKQVIDWFQKSKKPVVDEQVTNYMELLNANLYQKGSWVLHMLRNKIGDSLFWKGIRKYYNTYAGKNASSSDFQKIMESVSGTNLESFFHQWLYRSGHPQLQIEPVYKNGYLEVTITQVQPELFEFVLPLRLDLGAEGYLTKSMVIRDRTSSFRIPVSSREFRLLPDPQATLLFEYRIKLQ